MKLRKRIERIQKETKPKLPSVIIAHSREQAKQKLKSYFADNPYGPTPSVLIVEPIEKHPCSGR